MSAITRPIVSSPNQLRPFDVGRDLSAVADLVEACFAETLDTDGRRYVQQMHAAARNPRYLRWAATMADHVSMPLTGFVWEEHGQLVGNLSLIPFTYLGRRCLARHQLFHRRRRFGLVEVSAADHGCYRVTDH